MPTSAKTERGQSQQMMKWEKEEPGGWPLKTDAGHRVQLHAQGPGSHSFNQQKTGSSERERGRNHSEEGKCFASGALANSASAATFPVSRQTML